MILKKLCFVLALTASVAASASLQCRSGGEECGGWNTPSDCSENCCDIGADCKGPMGITWCYCK